MKKQVKNSRILVTGGAGFIGSNLVEVLLLQENEVVVLDNFSTGRQENLESFKNHKNFRLITGDIRVMDDCRKAVDGVDYILHQAALGSVPRSVKDPMTSTHVNILGFVNMLFAAQEAKVKRFVYASSSSVYGDSPVLPKVEAQTGMPLSPYAITKSVNEMYAKNFHDLYGIDTVGLRYFNVFGRRQDPYGAYAAVIPRFASALLKHESPVINGDGSYSRDFTYIENVVQANQCALLADDPSALNQAYNIACGDQITLLQLFDMLKQNLQRFDAAIAGIEPVFGAIRPGDIPHSLADISKARRYLNYDPEWNVEQGIAQAAEWYYRNL